jgi:HlyD family secretion protein
MPNNLHQTESIETPNSNPETSSITLESNQDWSYATKELLDTLPQAWTRGLLYFLVIFIAIVLPWAVFSKIDETGNARGRIEPREETIKLDSAVAGTVAEIRVKEGEAVKKDQVLLLLESDLVKSDLKQIQDKLEGQLNRRNQLALLKTQLIVALSTQQQQNKAAELEKQSQVDQAQENLVTFKNTYNLLKAEKQAQVSQAETTLNNNQDTLKINAIRFGNAKREIQRYQQAAEEGVASSGQVSEKEDLAQERQRIFEQSQSDIQQAKLRIKEQKSGYEKAIAQAQSDIEQGELRLNQQKKGLQSLIHTNELAILKIEEQLKNNDTEIGTLTSDIAQSQGQINSLKFQLSQRSLRSSVSGIIFQLPIQKAGAVVQVGTRVAEIATQNSPLIIRAQMPTTDSGSLREGLAVKLKFDAYPFQDYGILEGKLLKISPTTTLVETANGKVEMYRLEVSLNQTCMKTANQCIPLRPGDTATAEVIVRQRRIIDFVLDPFKKLQKGGLQL